MRKSFLLIFSSSITITRITNTCRKINSNANSYWQLNFSGVFNYILLLSIMLLIPLVNSYSQPVASVVGTITDEKGSPVSGANVVDSSKGTGTLTDTDGKFQLKVIADKEITIIISFLGYEKVFLKVNLKPGQIYTINQQLKTKTELLNEVVIESWTNQAESLEKINLKSIDQIPLPSGSFETLLTTLGASSRNEMSSQYSVRGGNFDENLIYVNDIEIYRPFLIKAGQQEGLSFINSSLIGSIKFSAGGFEAQYGDKMSSVLDIRYKKPVKFDGSITAGLLGASAHVEGCSKNHRFTFLSGVRYKSNQYLLNTLQTKGDYKPIFFDFQTFITHSLSKKIELSFLGYVAQNKYTVIPQSRETAFGTYQQTLNFTIYYEGQEVDHFTTLLGAVTVDYHPNQRLSLKLIASGYNTDESVTYDILGQYRIDLLDNTVGSGAGHDSILNIGYGGYLNHARNYMNANIFTISHKGSFVQNNFNLKWGADWQFEDIDDKLKEWDLLDSAGYSIPSSDNTIELYRSASAKQACFRTIYRLSPKYV